jgi:hypothetical protein
VCHKRAFSSAHYTQKVDIKIPTIIEAKKGDETRNTAFCEHAKENGTSANERRVSIRQNGQSEVLSRACYLRGFPERHAGL